MEASTAAWHVLHSFSQGAVCAGYLPGNLVPNIRFFAGMALLYLSLVGAWIGDYNAYWSSASMVQHCATAAIGLGLAEVSLWCARQC